MNNTTRCAIYLRISDEDGVKKELTSLESQEIYCREFIAAQNNWKPTKVYCDDGYTGGNTNRPALKRLLDDVQQDLFDEIVVYKYDRFTRSPADYFFIMTLLQQHNVALVAATEQINTSTPDGEFMMTNKMAVAQYERSITRERVKNKIAASRKLGIWTGGTIVPGFKSVDRKLEHDEEIAPLIRFMFQRYIETRSPATVANEMNDRALKLSQDATKRLKKMTRQRVIKLLSSPLYKGYIKHYGVSYKGRHEAIVDEVLWDQTQELLSQTPLKASPQRTPLEFALKGCVRCKECNKAMILNLTAKKAQKYAYYTCSNKRNSLPCKGIGIGINAELLHKLVATELRKILQDPDTLSDLWQADKDAAAQNYKNLENLDKAWDFLTPEEKNKILKTFVKVVNVSKQGLLIELTLNGLETGRVIIVKGSFCNRNHSPQLFVPKDSPCEFNDPELLKALVQAEGWQHDLCSGQTSEGLAIHHGLEPEYVRRRMFLTLLSPRIKEAIISGKLHPQWTLQNFTRKKPPISWKEQEAVYLAAS
jgi:DNA invertase Pin-like site-specific DNA recombinase